MVKWEELEEVEEEAREKADRSPMEGR